MSHTSDVIKDSRSKYRLKKRSNSRIPSFIQLQRYWKDDRIMGHPKEQKEDYAFEHLPLIPQCPCQARTLKRELS